MLSPEDIRELCERKYPAFLRSLVERQPFFPLKIRFGRPSPTDDWTKLESEIKALAAADLGYRIDWVEVNTRRWSRQRLPQHVWFDAEDSFLRMLRKTSEVEAFRKHLEHTRQACPELEGWLAANASWMLEHTAVWPQLLLVCRFFMANPRPNLYARELPIAVDTKFIERHQPVLRDLLDFLLPAPSRSDSPHFEKRFGLKFEEPRIHFRLLDPVLKQPLQLCVDDLSVPLSQFVALGWADLTLLIAENKQTFLTLPRLANTIAIFGGG